ncbi:hypothetical protein GDO81_021917 [Engystomops pustulosus]|uniref:Uncharacterized protein n=1 Tax=Engystomops pustulosus TaxID=76066 RepID=A0AAV6ZNY6_ENGPU|nr:hypothetical protein GDO81_021917 [Engystomops pustulosus]
MEPRLAFLPLFRNLAEAYEKYVSESSLEVELCVLLKNGVSRDYSVRNSTPEPLTHDPPAETILSILYLSKNVKYIHPSL